MTNGIVEIVAENCIKHNMYCHVILYSVDIGQLSNKMLPLGMGITNKVLFNSWCDLRLEILTNLLCRIKLHKIKDGSHL